MPHGYPDWGQTSGVFTTYQLKDLGELAVRLGSPVLFDRRGDVVFLETFKDGLNRWSSGISGTGAAVYLSSEYFASRGFSTYLRAGADDDHFAEIHQRLPLPRAGKVGLEVSHNIDGNLDTFGLELSWYDGGTNILAKCRYDRPNERIQVWDIVLGWIPVLENVATDIWREAFHTLKLVCDFENKQYVRVLFDHRSATLSQYTIGSGPNLTKPHLYTNIRNESIEGVIAGIHVDNVIMTQNEP